MPAWGLLALKISAGLLVAVGLAVGAFFMLEDRTSDVSRTATTNREGIGFVRREVRTAAERSRANRARSLEAQRLARRADRRTLVVRREIVRTERQLQTITTRVTVLREGLRGLTGEMGATGAAGAAGQGVTGQPSTVPGPAGPQGQPGADGADSTVPGPEGPQGPPGPASPMVPCGMLAPELGYACQPVTPPAPVPLPAP